MSCLERSTLSTFQEENALKLQYVVYPIMTAEVYTGKLDLDLSILVNNVEILETRVHFVENETYCSDVQLEHIPFEFIDSMGRDGKMTDRCVFDSDEAVDEVQLSKRGVFAPLPRSAQRVHFTEHDDLCLHSIGCFTLQMIEKDTRATTPILPSVAHIANSSYLLYSSSYTTGHYTLRIFFKQNFLNSFSISILSSNEKILVDPEGMIYASTSLFFFHSDFRHAEYVASSFE